MANAPVLGIVHTSFALVELLNNLVRAELPGVEVVNIVDDTLLAYARQHGVDDRLRRRMLNFFRAAEDAGAQVILNACSSVGETVDPARAQVGIPILKIDEPMARKAAQSGRRIAVLATVPSTLGPTRRLIEAQARAVGSMVEVSEVLCEGCFDLLVAGRKEEHDNRVRAAARRVAPDHDALVFAQASMSRLHPVVAAEISKPLLSSPSLAVEALRGMLRAPAAATR